MNSDGSVDGGEPPPVPPGVIVVVEEDGVPVIRLTGEIDSQVVAAYDRGRAAPAAVIDASGVTFLDCRGLRFLICQTRAARRTGARPVLRRPARIVRRVVEMADAGNCFTITG